MTRRTLIAWLVGTLVLLVIGLMTYGLILPALMPVSMQPLPGARDAPLLGFIVISQALLAALLTIVIGTWARVRSLAGAFGVGGVAGGLVSARYITNLFGFVEFPIVMLPVESALGFVLSGVAGVAIGFVLKVGGQPTSAAAAT